MAKFSRRDFLKGAALAAGAGLAPEDYTIRVTTHAGHARELSRAAAAAAENALHRLHRRGGLLAAMQAR